MSSTAQQSPAAPTPIPLTQNTAPVIEFRCLFTPDLRRKQKRWQDGRLKFHTFNKRVMVYDEKLNFVGDTHWHDNELDEGEELELERGGVLVQVADCLGRKDQDLTELLDKRVKEKEERASARIRASPAPSGATFSPIPSARQPRAFAALPQKPLSALLGTPSGHHGKALLPRASPFEDRQNALAKERGDQEKPSKRRKVESPYAKAGYAQNLTGVALDLSSTPRSTAAFRREPLWARTSRSQEGKESTKTDDNVQNLRPNEKHAPSNNLQGQPRQTQRLRLASEKEAKSGYAQNLTGAVLDLSSTQKSNTFLRRQPLPARRSERETSLKSHSDGGERDQSVRQEPVQSGILQPLVESLNTRPLTSKRDAIVPGQRTEKLVKAGTERSLAFTVKARKEISGRTNAERQEHSRIIIESDDSSGVDDDFIDIDAFEQAYPVPKPPIFNKTKDGPQSNRDAHVPSSVQSPGKSPPGVSRMQKDNLPAQTSLPAQEATRSPAEPVSVIRLKSRPKRRMLFGDRQSVVTPISTNQKPSSPAKEVVPEQSQATKRLDAFHKMQQEKLEARIGRRMSALRNSDNDSSGDDDAYPEDTGDKGLDHNAIDNVLLRKPSMVQAISSATANPLDRESLFDKTVRPNRPAALEKLLQTPNNSSDGIQHPTSKPSQPPQSSEPAFEELRDVVGRISRARNSIVHKARVEPLLQRKVRSMPAETTIQGKATKRTRSKEAISPSHVFDDGEEKHGSSAADESTTEEVPVEPARKKPQFLKTSKKARSKEVVGWVVPAKDMAIIQPRPDQMESIRPPISQHQVTPFKSVTRADKETRTGPEPETAEVAAPKPAQHSLPRRKLAAKEGAVQVPEKKGVTVGTMGTDIGPWSREAFDLFDWRPKELG